MARKTEVVESRTPNQCFHYMLLSRMGDGLVRKGLKTTKGRDVCLRRIPGMVREDEKLAAKDTKIDVSCVGPGEKSCPGFFKEGESNSKRLPHREPFLPKANDIK